MSTSTDNPRQSSRIRAATWQDLPALNELIPRSVRALSEGFYTPRQIESAICRVFGADTTLISDGTYYVAVNEDATLAGCGGWSQRRTLFGGDQMKAATPAAPFSDDLLDPAHDAARIRAFFVAPGQARRGVASALLRACITAAAAAGFRRLDLAATLPGVPFYRAQGFAEDGRLDAVLPDGTAIAFVRMSANMEGPRTTPSPPDVPA